MNTRKSISFLFALTSLFSFVSCVTQKGAVYSDPSVASIEVDNKPYIASQCKWESFFSGKYYSSTQYNPDGIIINKIESNLRNGMKFSSLNSALSYLENEQGISFIPQDRKSKYLLLKKDDKVVYIEKEGFNYFAYIFDLNIDEEKLDSYLASAKKYEELDVHIRQKKEQLRPISDPTVKRTRMIEYTAYKDVVKSREVQKVREVTKCREVVKYRNEAFYTPGTAGVSMGLRGSERGEPGKTVIRQVPYIDYEYYTVKEPYIDYEYYTVKEPFTAYKAETYYEPNPLYDKKASEALRNEVQKLNNALDEESGKIREYERSFYKFSY